MPDQLSVHATPTTPKDCQRCSCRSLPTATSAFSVSQADRRPHLHFRGLLRIHSRCGLHGCNPTLRGALSPGLRHLQLPKGTARVATEPDRQLFGEDSHLQVDRALVAHCDMQVRPARPGDARQALRTRRRLHIALPLQRHHGSDPAHARGHAELRGTTRWHDLGQDRLHRHSAQDPASQRGAAYGQGSPHWRAGGPPHSTASRPGLRARQRLLLTTTRGTRQP